MIAVFVKKLGLLEKVQKHMKEDPKKWRKKNKVVKNDIKKGQKVAKNGAKNNKNIKKVSNT